MTISIVAPSFWVDGMKASEYHAHKALSSTGARALLRSPARFAYERVHPITPTREMEIGTAVHTSVLGVGLPWHQLPGDDLRVKATKAAAEEITAAGFIALKPAEANLVRGMFRAVIEHPLAGPLLSPDKGVAERALFWTDPDTHIDCRAMLDFSPHNRRSIVDLKTTSDASPTNLGRHMARYGYPIQAAWYLRGARQLGLADEGTEFVWVFVERDPPHLVSVVRLAPLDMEWADERCTRAMEMYRDCTGADSWPGYPTDLITVSLPPYGRREYEDEEHTW